MNSYWLRRGKLPAAITYRQNAYRRIARIKFAHVQGQTNVPEPPALERLANKIVKHCKNGKPCARKIKSFFGGKADMPFCGAHVRF
jgi:hypothetical protein